MDHRHLSNLTDCIATFLARVLPGLSGRWWQTHVLDELSFQQREYAERAGHNRLDQFDLAALLRIADRNWSEVARAGSLAPEARNWLKEAQSIRNRWAHAPAAGIPDDARYRDLDTIERLMQALGAEAAALAEIHADRSALLARLAGIAESTGAAPGNVQIDGAGQDGFEPGQMVRLKARPATTGVIVARLPSDAEARYQVFHDASLTTYYASQIEPATLPEARPSVAPQDLHAALTALQLRHPSTGHLYSLFAARASPATTFRGATGLWCPSGILAPQLSRCSQP